MSDNKHQILVTQSGLRLDKFIHTQYDFGKPVIFGHTPLGEPLVESNKIGIDTGAVYGGKLTCVQLPDLVFFTV